MLQIIGFIGCFYLIMKSFEFGSSSAYRDADNRLRGTAATALFLAPIGAIIFAVWLIAQGSSMSSFTGTAPIDTNITSDEQNLINVDMNARDPNVTNQ